MNQPAPAPEWTTPAPTDAPPAPALAAAPAPAPVPAPPVPAGFAMPTGLDAALDVTVPLVPVQPSAPGMQPAFAPQQADPAPQQPPMEQVVPAPVNFAALAQQPQPTHADHPTSLAMPVQAAEAAPASAMPAMYEEPFAVDATSTDDFADLHPAPAGDAAPDAGAIPSWAQPGTALVVAMFALSFQLIAFYAREALPNVKAAGQTLDYFDTIVDRLPLIAGTAGSMIGMLLGFAGLMLMVLGLRAGVREPILQGAIGVIALVAAAATVLLPILAS